MASMETFGLPSRGDDMSKADVRMDAPIKASLDTVVADQISERAKRGVVDKAVKGEWLGSFRPFGWGYTIEEMQGDGKIKKIYKDTHLLNNVEAKMVRDAIRHVNERGTVGQILRDWTESGVTTTRGTKVWRHPGVNRILTRWRNAGVMEHQGRAITDVDASWEPICTREELDQVRAVILDPTRRNGPGFVPTHLLSGIPRCAKDGYILKSGEVRSHGKTYRIYRCSAPKCGQAMKIEDLDRVVSRYVEQAYLRGPRDRFETARAELKELPAQTHRGLAAVLAERREIEEAIHQSLTSVTAMRPTLGRLAESERVLRQDIERHHRENAHAAMLASVAEVDRHESNLSIEKASTDMKGTWDALPLHVRRRLIRTLFAVTVHPGTGEDRVEITDYGSSLVDDGRLIPLKYHRL